MIEKVVILPRQGVRHARKSCISTCEGTSGSILAAHNLHTVHGKEII